jgi:uncharacterized protein (TIGR00661 family)
MSKPKNIIIAPLNWGLGHATRCIPLIIELQNNGFTPIIASDGNALALLIKEFPNLKNITLPSYGIKYSKKGVFLKLKLALGLPKLIHAVKNEKSIIDKIAEKENICGIISDNRFGIYHKNIPSIYITHQINVLSGFTTFLTSKVHQKIIKKFDECWIPDFKSQKNYSGKLSENSTINQNIKYIGTLSRFKKTETKEVYDYLIILSGPEPQRTMLENVLLVELKKSNKKILFIRGVLESKEKTTQIKNITYQNYMTSKSLELAVNQSKIIIARSGYSTIMDLSKMNKKTFFIPTPGQHEQLYLAKRLKKLNYSDFSKQNDFKLEKLVDMKTTNNLKDSNEKLTDFNNLFSCFNGKRKF